MDSLETHYWFARFLFQRSLGFIYFLGFLIVINQFIGLVGHDGLLPARHYLKRAKFWHSPSIFHFIPATDLNFRLLGYIGLVLSMLALTGISDSYGIWFSVFVWRYWNRRER